jgi:hypothetical protein
MNVLRAVLLLASASAAAQSSTSFRCFVGPGHAALLVTETYTDKLATSYEVMESDLHGRPLAKAPKDCRPGKPIRIVTEGEEERSSELPEWPRLSLRVEENAAERDALVEALIEDFQPGH